MPNAAPEKGIVHADASFGAQPHERPVPRISIHAFCEFPDTGAALQRAAADRRLSKADVTVQLGGLQAALDQYAGQATPNLLIIETRLQGRMAVEEIERLAEVCDAATKVVIVGRVNDVELYRDLLRRGVSEYLVAPLNPLHLIEIISGLYLNPEFRAHRPYRDLCRRARRGWVLDPRPHVARWIAERLKINTAIVDLDLPFGTSGLDFNEEPGPGVADALLAPERLDDVLLDRLLSKVGEHLSLFTAPAVIERTFEAEPETFEAVIDAVRRSSPCVVIDLPHMWTSWVRQTLLGSDDIVIVATPDLASLRNTKAFVDLIRTNRANDLPPRLVLTQVGQPKRPEIPVKDFGATVGIAPSLVLQYEPALYGAAANNGQMIGQMKPQSPAAEGIRQLAELVTGRTEPDAPRNDALPIAAFLKRLISDLTMFGKRTTTLEPQPQPASPPPVIVERRKSAPPPPPPPSDAPNGMAPPPPPPATPRPAPSPVQAPTASKPIARAPDSRSEEYYQIKTTIFSALIDTIDLAQLAQLDAESAREEIRDIVNEIISIKAVVMSIAEQENLLQDICNDVLGYGPLEPLLARDDISDIMVNGAGRVFIEVKGKIQLTNVRFRDNAQLMNICQRIVSQVGRRVTKALPFVTRACSTEAASTSLPRRSRWTAPR